MCHAVLAIWTEVILSSAFKIKYSLLTDIDKSTIFPINLNKLDLSDNDKKDIFQRDIEEEFSVRRSTATGILQLMEKNNLIKREPVSYDARLKKLVLTKKALDIQNEINQEIKAHDKKLSQNISKDDLEIFFKVMKQIRKNLGE